MSDLIPLAASIIAAVPGIVMAWRHIRSHNDQAKLTRAETEKVEAEAASTLVSSALAIAEKLETRVASLEGQMSTLKKRGLKNKIELANTKAELYRTKQSMDKEREMRESEVGKLTQDMNDCYEELKGLIDRKVDG